MWCRGELGVMAAELTAWRDAFLAAGESSLKTRPADGRDLEIGRLKAKVGDLTMTTELLEAKIERLEGGRPLARRRSRPLSKRTNSTRHCSLSVHRRVRAPWWS
jgi:transposase